MPAESIPVLAAIIAAFAFFIIAVGGASLWTALPRRLHQDPGKGMGDDL